MGPEEMLGGYFLTPQTNPPTPWPAEKFADLFAKEVTEGMVVPRVERRGAAGPRGHHRDSATGMTATEESLFRGAARAAWPPASRSPSATATTPLHDLEVVLDEKLPADRVVVGELDRKDAVAAGAPLDRRPRRLRRHRPRRTRRRRLRHRRRARRPGRRARRGRPRGPDPALEQRDRRRQGPARHDLLVQPRPDRPSSRS